MAISVGPSRLLAEWLTRAGASARAYSSWKMICWTRLSPRPPYSSGQPSARPAVLGQQPVPREPLVVRLVVATGTAEAAQVGALAGQVLLEPAAHLGAERLVRVGVGQVHG